jgi:UDPglucose 6-dehydrogenase
MWRAASASTTASAASSCTPAPVMAARAFPKDTLALIRTAQEAGAPARIVETVEAVNKARKLRLAARVEQACGGSLPGKRIALLGLAFKPNTDDMRDAPSIDLVAGLLAAGARVSAYDPESMAQARPLMPGVDFHDDAYACAEGADALVIVTEWDAFRALDLARVKTALKAPVVVDLRNIYRPEDMRRRGFAYSSIGRA